MRHPVPQVQEVGEIIADHMDAILKLFRPPVKITVVVRSTSVSDGSRDLIQTNDTLDDVIAALRLRKAAPTVAADV